VVVPGLLLPSLGLISDADLGDVDSPRWGRRCSRARISNPEATTRAEAMAVLASSLPRSRVVALILASPEIH
jgi:hypothetical protein